MYSIIVRFICLLGSLSMVASIQKRFIFRMDDIEDYNKNQVQADVINYLIDHNLGVTVGIIGDFVSGEDKIIYNALKRCVSMSKDKCALFNHGPDAAQKFAEITDYSLTYNSIKRCDDTIKRLFPGYQAEMFVPNENSWNEVTVQAIKDLGYYGISASRIGQPQMAFDLTTKPIRMPQQTTTGQFVAGDWIHVPIQQSVSECNAAIDRGEVCVIMIHPHEFANGQYTLTELGWLAGNLTANGYESVNFHTVIKEVFQFTESPTAAPTVAPTKGPIPGAFDSNGPIAKFFTDPEDYGIAVMAIVGMIFCLLSCFGIQYCRAGSNKRFSFSSLEKDSVLTAEDSIELGIPSDEKYIPTAGFRRKFSESQDRYMDLNRPKIEKIDEALLVPPPYRPSSMSRKTDASIPSETSLELEKPRVTSLSRF